ITRRRAQSAVSEPAVVETPSGRAISHTVLGVNFSTGVVNVSMREPGNVKRREVVGATKRMRHQVIKCQFLMELPVLTIRTSLLT
ncbi:hypothetical protein BD770DRAFT_321859, partial [Pilaira anomala]